VSCSEVDALQQHRVSIPHGSHRERESIDVEAQSKVVRVRPIGGE
jgi:hypothetical protein